ncbi:glycosyltransferase family 4 protein [Pseudomonadota bacterium]
MTELVRKLDGYRRKLNYEWAQRRNARAAKKREVAFEAWLNHLETNPPEVLLGANFSSFGGVRHHIQAIQHFSSMNVELAPSEQLMQKLKTHHFTHDFHEKFLSFPAAGIKVVHSHVFPWFIEWCRERQKSGLRWVHTYHLNYYPEHGVDVLEPWQQEINHSLLQVARHADVCLSVSKWQVEELAQQHGIESQYLPNGVDIAKCDAADATRFVQKTGLENFVLYVGRNDPVKNPEEFVRLAQLLPDYRFVMIGGGLSGHSLQRDWNVEVPSNLRVLGSLPHAEVLDGIAACSTLVVTSKREGLPTLVMEGMTQSKAVVVTNEPGCMEVIGHGEAGVIYEAGNIDDLMKKTLRAMTDCKIGAFARQRVLAEYDWRQIAPKLDAIYSGGQVNFDS